MGTIKATQQTHRSNNMRTPEQQVKEWTIMIDCHYCGCQYSERRTIEERSPRSGKVTFTQNDQWCSDCGEDTKGFAE
tara:strand:+ start:206 stop:436 length:231 start_codon:yes stop_codon:yes gene_type:complete